MKRSRGTALMAGIALTAICANSTTAFAQAAKPESPRAPSAQPAQTTQSAPMVKSPDAASGAGGSSNPDNMPIKRPDKPTNDKMMHAPPASGANAK